MPDIADLHDIRERLVAAENAHDAEVMIGMMAEDIVLMVPDFPVQEGRATCASFIRGVTDCCREDSSRRSTYVSDEVCVIGELAIDRGTFSFTFEWKDGREDAVVEAGKYLWIYSRNHEGAW